MTTKTNPDRLPRKFHRQADDTIVCEHRDVSCCPVCVADFSNLRPMLGVVYWMTDAEMADFVAECGGADEIAADLAETLRQAEALLPLYIERGWK